MPPAANCAADTTRVLRVEAPGRTSLPILGAVGPPPIPLGLYAFIAITGAKGSDLGPQGAILPSTATNPLEVPTPNPWCLSSH